MAPARATAREQSGMALPAVVCLALAAGALGLGLPRGFALGGVPLGLPLQAALSAAAVAVGAWGAFSARAGRVGVATLAAAALLVPGVDARAPLERLPLYLAAAVLFLLYAELALLHARIARLAALPRAHVTQVGQARETDLRSTAGRIAGSWPVPLALAVLLLGLAVLAQALLQGLAPPALGRGVELRGPFGLALGGVLLLGPLGLLAARRARAQDRGSSGDAGSGGGAGSGSGAGASAPGGP